MFLNEAAVSQNLLNVIELINFKPARSFVFEVKGGGQAAGRAVRYHLIDFSTLQLHFFSLMEANEC